MRIAVLITCHNRRVKTLACLSSLLNAIRQFRDRAAVCKSSFDLFLVDDGSTDGTGAAVQEWAGTIANASSLLVVHLIRGGGSLYWAKGMALAWENAIAQTDGAEPYTHYLWLNDDVMLHAGALCKIFAACNDSVVVNGTLVDEAGMPAYGLNVRNTGLAGNCVLVPRKVYEKVGIICGQYSHGWADRDYGLQVEKNRFRIVSAGIVGQAEWHAHRPSLRGLTIRERLTLLRDPKGWNLHDLWLLRRRNWNVLFAIISCTHLIAHVMIGER